MANEKAKTAVTSPPAGTGNVPGLGEAFKINFSTGQGTYSYKIALPRGVAGHTPLLVLEYMHGTGHSIFGLGWRVPLRSIARRLDFGVPGEGTVESYIDSGSEILPMPDGTFAARVETVFSRYSRTGDGWRIEDRNGMIHELGSSAAARLTDPGHPERIDEWLLERSLDPSGNLIEYSYLIDEGIVYPSEIHYAIYSVRFTYEDRPDQYLNGRAGYLRKCRKRCKKIELFIDSGPNERRIRSWIITYTQADGSNNSLLSSIQMISYGIAKDGSQDVIRPPTTFQYSSFELQRSSICWMKSSDGSYPPSLTDPDVVLVTLDNAPLIGVLHINNGRQYYWRNLGDGTWAPPRPVTRIPSVSSFSNSRLAFIDMNASGTADLMVSAGSFLPGYYENGGLEGWKRFVAYPRGRHSAPLWISEQLRLSDINGDGRIDAIMSTQHSFAIWLNQGENGWSDPMLIPKGEDDSLPDFSDPLVFLADMTGDGLDDLVRVRSGLVEYWPGLGYGRFGEKQVMKNSPRLRDLTLYFCQSGSHQLMLVDVDGDGCADLVRVTSKGVEVYINQSGVSFSNQGFIPDIPSPIPGTVRPFNLRGRKGTGLVWNTPHGQQTGYICLEFGSEQPAYLLNYIENGSGLISEIFYRSAVEDFCRDRQAGIQWNTNFPFPYLVVAGTREIDQVSGQVNETNYCYHEGHFEPRTRQFQGFKRSERVQRGDESRVDVLTVFHFLMAEELKPGHGSEYAALNGMQRRIETYSLDNSVQQARPYRVEECGYGLQVLGKALDGRMRVFVSVDSHRVEDWERTSDVRVEEKTYTYDALGNVIVEKLHGSGILDRNVMPERIRITEIEYASSSTRWIIDRPSRIVVRDENNAIIMEKRRYYDSPDFFGMPLGEVDLGLMTREEQLVMSEVAFQVHYNSMDTAALGYHLSKDVDGVSSLFVNIARIAYDLSGVKIAECDALGYEKRFEYDSSHLFRIKLIDPLGETLFDYDRAVGQVIRTVHADGAESRFFYDAQGRVLTALLPVDDPACPPREFIYNDVKVPNSRTTRFKISNDPDGTTSTVSYFDGYGKEFQQRVEIGGGRVIVSGLIIRNPWGDLKQEYEPTFADTLAFSIPSTIDKTHREIYFDGLGRMIRTVDYSGGTSLAEYYPFEVVLHDANDTDASPANVARGQFKTPRHEEFDVLRYRTRIIEELGGGNNSITTFVIGASGEVLQIHDSNGLVCECEYDKLGRRLLTAHRDAGHRRMWHDGRGKVVRTIDANGNDLRADMDTLGRITRLSANGMVIETYTYDDLTRNALGRLAEVTYSGGRQSFRYDTAGRPILHEYKFDVVGETYTLAFEYDALGREVALVHTDGTRIVRSFTPNGRIRAIAGILDEVVYNARSLPTRIVFSNGVTTDITYTDGPGRVKTQRTLGPGGQVMEDLNYSYDQLQMLLYQTDATLGATVNHKFDYDPLYQLRRTISDEGKGSIIRECEYKDDFNLTRFDESGYFMHYDDATYPNRISGITWGAEPRFDPAYDPNGNLLTLPGKTFSYNAKNELVRFHDVRGLSAEYLYDHQGYRISKVINDDHGLSTQKLFLGKEAEISDGKPTYFVYLGGLRVAIIKDGLTRFVHSNYLGSTTFFTDLKGIKTAAISYQPFGNLKQASTGIDHCTYSIHPIDLESGLCYMHRRYYAPEIGRFTTPDPLAVYQPQKVMLRPRSLHVYAYAGNDPLNNYDSHGLSFWSVFGAIVGTVISGGLAPLMAMTGMTDLTTIGVVLVSYIAASKNQDNDFGEFMRGFMIGTNAGINGAIGTLIFGPDVGTALGVINFLCSNDSFADNCHGILGWSNWLMPMSWIVMGIGISFFIFNLAASGIGWNAFGSEQGRIHKISIDWNTGAIITEGGLLTKYGKGYNLGFFVFLGHDKATAYTADDAHWQHETGHNLNVAAFGQIFHLVGWIDEIVVQDQEENAYAEQIAEGHVTAKRDPPRPELPMW